MTQFKCLIIYNIFNVDIITKNVAHASNNVCACACVQYSIFAYQISPNIYMIHRVNVCLT